MMIQSDQRAALDFLVRPTRGVARAFGALCRVGLAKGDREHTPPTMLEGLEPRVLLATNVILDGSGNAVLSDVISGSQTEVIFKLTAPTTDFVTFLADGLNSADFVDTTIDVYFDEAKTQRATDAFGRPILRAENSGTVASGTSPNAFVGRVLQAGTDYFVVVSSTSLMAGEFTGAFDLRVSALPSVIDVSTTRTLYGNTDSTPNVTDLNVAGTSQVYKFTTGAGSAFNSLISVNAVADVTDLDTRIEIFDSEGRFITADSGSGRISNAFATFKAEVSSTYYLRIRSDQFLSTISTATGEFALVIESQARGISIDQATRFGAVINSFETLALGTSAAPLSLIRADSRLFQFTAEGTGLAVVMARPIQYGAINNGQTTENVPLPSEEDVKLRIYDDQGNLVQVADDFATGDKSPQAEFNVVIGKTYYVVADNFDIDFPVSPTSTDFDFFISVEANAIYRIDPDTGGRTFDDRIDAPTANIVDPELRRILEEATPIIWGAPTRLFEDRGFVVTGTADGRLHGLGDGDSDLFQFVPPIDMDFGNTIASQPASGPSLFVGGTFNSATFDIDPTRPEAFRGTNGQAKITTPGLTAYDFGRFWQIDDSQRLQNTTLFAADTQLVGEIRTMIEWTRPGDTSPVLIVGGLFELVGSNPLINGIKNIAAWDGISWQSIMTTAALPGSFNANTPFNEPRLGLNATERSLFSLDGGPVNALALYDLDGNGGNPESLIIGGGFAPTAAQTAATGMFAGYNAPGSFLAAFTYDLQNNGSFVASWTEINRSTSGNVITSTINALATYDPPQPVDTSLPDPGLTLYSGTDDGILFRFEAVVNTASVNTMLPFIAPTVSGASSAIYALTVYDPPPEVDPADNTQTIDRPAQLVIGGRFGGKSATNTADWADPGGAPIVSLVEYDNDVIHSPTRNFTTGLLKQGTVDPVVYSLATWTQPPSGIPGAANFPGLVVGGAFDVFTSTLLVSNVAIFDEVVVALGVTTDLDTFKSLDAVLGIDMQGIDTGLTGTVRTLTTFIDTDGAGSPDVFDTSEVLSIGGDLMSVKTSALDTGGVNSTVFFFGRNSQRNYDPLGLGTDNTVLALTSYNDKVNGFSRNGRPSSGLQVRVTGTLETLAGFLEADVRLFDSLNVPVGSFTPVRVARAAGLPQGPVGSNDESLYTLGFESTGTGVKLWGGETYYLEVFSSSVGRPIGRYTVEVMVDALVDSSVKANNLDSFFREHTEATESSAGILSGSAAAQAISVIIDRALGTGTTFNGNTSFFERVFSTRNDGTQFRILSGQAGIESYTDTDLFVFTAVRDGFAEIVTSTFQIQDQQTIVSNNIATGQTTTATTNRTYNSSLDTVLKVYDSTLVQVASNDNIEGLSEQINGGFTTIPFDVANSPTTLRPSDSRVVFQVRAGEQYFIAVSSSQRDAIIAYQAGDKTVPVDWRFALGSYEMVVNLGGSPSGDQFENTDDFIDGDAVGNTSANFAPNFATFNRAAPIGFDTSGVASISGAIQSGIPGNPIDTDLFTFTSPVTGVGTITLSRTNVANGLNTTVQIFDANNLLIISAPSNANGDVQFTLNLGAGERYFVLVSSPDGTTGGYDLAVSGLLFQDDNVGIGQWISAPEIAISGGAGNVGTATGTIDFISDSDIFSFRANDIANYTVSVTSPSGSLDPRLDIFVTNTTPDGNTYLTRIGVNDNRATNDAASELTFGGRPLRTNTTLGINLPLYFILVRSADGSQSNGSYQININLAVPDDHPNAGQTDLATPIVVDDSTGVGTQTGLFEIASDSDQFIFTSPAGGPASVTVTTPANPTLRLQLDILDASGVPIRPTQVAPVAGSPVTVSFNALRGQQFLVVVRPFDDGVSAQTGFYSVVVTAPPLDDHANSGEWGFATSIALDGNTGDAMVPAGATARPQISPATDTDLFTFESVAVGQMSVTITPFVSSTLDLFTALVSIFDGPDFGSIVTTGIASAPGGAVTVTFNASSVGQTFFIQIADINANADSITSTDYEINILGPDGPGVVPPGTIDFANPTAINADLRDGQGSISDVIGIVGDRDLFSFNVPTSTPAKGRPIRMFVQVVTPGGSPLDAKVTIFNMANELMSSVVVTDAIGGTGSSARVSFTGTEGQQFWVLVEAADTSNSANNTGNYRIDISVEPQTYFQYFPEGWGGDGITESISISNPNTFDVSYQVVAYFEDTSIAPIVVVPFSSGTIGAGTRDSEILGDGTTTDIAGVITTSSGIPAGVGYSLAVESTGPLAVTSARFGFGGTAGEAFTDQTSAAWTFARVERNPGIVNDFILVYNPNNFDVDVTLTTVLANGSTITINLSSLLGGPLGANRRGGFNINDQGTLPLDVFGVTITASATNAANNAAFIGIVASQTHYTTDSFGDSSAYAILGDPTSGSVASVITSVTNGPNVTGEIVLFNSNSEAASVTLTGTYFTSGLPGLIRQFNIGAGQVLRLTGTDLNLIDNEAIGIEVRSIANASNNILPVTVLASEQQRGESNSIVAASNAAQQWFFGDSVIRTADAGTLFFDTVSLYNPNTNLSGSPVIVTLDFQFFRVSDGASLGSDQFSINVDSRGFASVDLHTLSQILSRTDPTVYFSLSASAADPFVMAFSHYDLTTGNGWGINGTPFGLLNSLNEIWQSAP